MILYAVGLALFAAFFAWRWTVDKFAWLNAWADACERLLPRFLRWPPDPITWVHHASFTELAGLGMGAWAWICGVGFAWGFAEGATVMVAFYGVREGYGLRKAWGSPGMWWRGWPHLTGWFVDGIMDFLCPFSVAVYAWVLVF